MVLELVLQLQIRGLQKTCILALDSSLFLGYHSLDKTWSSPSTGRGVGDGLRQAGVAEEPPQDDRLSGEAELSPSHIDALETATAGLNIGSDSEELRQGAYSNPSPREVWR